MFSWWRKGKGGRKQGEFENHVLHLNLILNVFADIEKNEGVREIERVRIVYFCHLPIGEMHRTVACLRLGNQQPLTIDCVFPSIFPVGRV